MPSVRDFTVTVIIPVYNAESYLSKAVESAVYIEEVEEIILIEDQSPDNALALAVSLEQEFDKVKLFQHPDKKNHGAGASRNLGIQKASCEYIAFLDADDYYLPNRFFKDKLVFQTHDNCDGVYSAVGTHFYSQEAKNDFFEKGFGYQEILTLTGKVAPEALFSVLFNRHQNIIGEFHTNGITLKKSVFEKVGYFNTGLKLRQDIHLWKRLAGFCCLYAGHIKTPTAMRGIHSQNRMTRVKDHDRYRDLWWRSLKREFKSKAISQHKFRIFEQAYINYYAGHSNKWIALRVLLWQCLKYPKTIAKAYGDFDFNVWKVFGKNWLTLHTISFKNRFLFKNL